MNVAPSTASHLRMRPDVERPDCDRVTKRLWEYLDDELPDREAHAIDQHVESCDRCHAAMMSARRMLSAVASSRWTTRAPAALRERVAQLRSRAPRGD